MSRTWGHEFNRISGITRAFMSAPSTHIWLVRYWRRIGGSDCRVNATLTEAQARAMATKLGVELPGQTKQLDIFESASEERQWDEPSPLFHGS